MQQQNNSLKKIIMSINRHPWIDEFIEYQRKNLNELIQNLTLYYKDIRLYISTLSDKSNQRYLFYTIIFTLLFLTIITLIIFEYRRLFKYIEKFFRSIYSYNKYLFIRIRNKFLYKTTPSLLNLLLNSKSHIRENFSKQFLQTLNQEFSKQKKVKNNKKRSDEFSLTYI